MECKRCKKKPSEIEEYVEAAEANGYTPEAYVKSQEGTYNRDTGKFYCTACYIKAGMPLGVA